MNDAPPSRQLAILFAAGDIDGQRSQRLRHFARLIQFPIRTRFFEVRHAVVMQESPDRNRFIRRITGVGIDQQRDIFLGRKRRMHALDDVFGPAGPFINIAAAFGCDAVLESVKTMRVAQLKQPRDLLLAADVAAHRRCIYAQLARFAAEQPAHRLLFQFAAQVPQRRIQTGQRAPQIRAGEFMFEFRNARHQRRDVQRILAQRMRRDLTVQHLRGDVGVIRRHLPPTARATVGGHPDQADEAVAECFDGGDFHNPTR